MTIKLSDVYLSAEGWNELVKLKKSPKLAYRLLKYSRKVNRELKLIEKQKSLIIYELAGVEPPKEGEVLMVDISADAEKMRLLNERFNAFTDQACDLTTVGVTLNDVVEDCARFSENSLTERDLAVLEPFFDGSEEVKT